MKKLFLIVILCFSTPLFAQTDRELLLELSKQQTELFKQVAELSKQQAITATKVDAMDKRFDAIDKRFDATDKRIDMLLSIIIATSGILFAGIFGLIGVIFWDRKTTAQPFEAKTDKLQTEVNLIKEKELKLEKRLLKNENNFKRIAEIDPRFANIS